MRVHGSGGEVGCDHGPAVGVDDLDGLDAAGRRVQSMQARRGKNVPHLKGTSLYSENMVEMMLTTIFSLVRSVAVRSMKMFRVLSVILLCSELMMGGKERTTSFLS